MSKLFLKYGEFFRISFKQCSKNFPLLFGSFFLLSLLLLTYNQLWLVIDSQSKLNVSFLWYLLFAEIIIICPPRIDRILDNDVRSGNMTYFISKPISFFGMRFSEALGEMTAVFLFLLLTGGGLTYLLTKHQVPFEFAHFPIIVAMAYGSSLINLFIKCCSGLSALWLSSTRYLNMIIDKSSFILGGAIIPITIYPEWFINFAKYTPFYSFYYLTLRLTYEFSWQNLVLAISLNIFWLGLIGFFLKYTYKKLSKRTEIYGG